MISLRMMGFHMLVRVLETERVDVMCVQKVFAGDFPRLLVNQPYWYDGPANSRGRDSGFLVRSSVSSVAIPGVVDSMSVRWRVFAGAVCVCNFHDPTQGLVKLIASNFGRSCQTGPLHHGSAHVSCWRRPCVAPPFPCGSSSFS